MLRNIIKNLILLALTICLVSCKQEPVLTYAEGLANCEALKTEQSNIVSSCACLEGYQLPDFKSITNVGESIETRDLLGKPTVMNFWFIGCVPCELEIPGLEYLGNKYKAEVNFVAIGINTKKALDKYLEKEQVWNYTHINDPKSELIDNIFQYDSGYPLTFIVDQDGKIVKAFNGGSIDEDAEEQVIASIEPILLSLLED